MSFLGSLVTSPDDHEANSLFPLVSPNPNQAAITISPFQLPTITTEANSVDQQSLAAASSVLFQHNQGLLQDFVGNHTQMKPLSYSVTCTKDQTHVTKLSLEAVCDSDMPTLAEIGPHNKDPMESRPLVFNYVSVNCCAATKRFLNQCLIYVAMRYKTKEGVPPLQRCGLFLLCSKTESPLGCGQFQRIWRGCNGSHCHNVEDLHRT